MMRLILSALGIAIIWAVLAPAGAAAYAHMVVQILSGLNALVFSPPGIALILIATVAIAMRRWHLRLRRPVRSKRATVTSQRKEESPS